MKKIWQADTSKLFIAILFFWLSLYIHIPFQVVHLNRFAIASGLLGLIVGAYGYMQALFRIPLSLLSERVHSPKKLLMVGAFLPAVAAFVRLKMNSPAGFFFANILGGLAASSWILFIVEFSKKMEKEQPEQKNAAALINMANQSGILIGYVLSVLLYKNDRLSGILICSVLFSLLSVLVLCTIKERSNLPDEIGKSSAVTQERGREKILSILRNQQLIRLLPIGFLHFGLLTATVQSLSIKKVSRFYTDKVSLGLINIIFMFSTVAFSLLLNQLMKRKKRYSIDEKWILIFGFVLETIYHIAFIFTEKMAGFIILQCMAGLFSAIIATYGIKLSLQSVPEKEKNVGMGFYQTFVALGMSIMPFLIGVLMELLGFAAAYSFVVFLTLLQVVYIYFTFKK